MCRCNKKHQWLYRVHFESKYVPKYTHIQRLRAKKNKQYQQGVITCGRRFERVSDWLTPVNRAEHLHVQRHVVDSEWYQVVDRQARCVIATDDFGCCTVLLKKKIGHAFVPC